MIGRNICFKGVILEIIPKLSFLPLLIWSTEVSLPSCSAIFVSFTVHTASFENARWCLIGREGGRGGGDKVEGKERREKSERERDRCIDGKIF